MEFEAESEAELEVPVVSTSRQQKDKTVAQLELVEQFLSENGDPYPL